MEPQTTSIERWVDKVEDLELYGLVHRYFVIRPALGESVGELPAAEIVRHVVGRLQRTFPSLADRSSRLWE